MPSTVPTALAMRPMICTVAAGGRVEAGEHLEGAGLQRVAGQDGDGLAEGHVAGGLAAAQVVVVEGGQVVVDERVGVKHLQGRAQPLDSLGQRPGDGDGGLHGQHRPEALAAGKDGVAHGAVNRGRHGVYAGKQLLQRPVGQLRALLNQRFHVGRHCFLMLDERGPRLRSKNQRAASRSTLMPLSQRPARTSGRVVQSMVRSMGPCGTGTAMRPSSRLGNAVSSCPFRRMRHAG